MFKNLLLFIFTLVFITSSASAADDRMINLLGNLAVGIVGKALDDAATDTQKKEEITWSDKSQGSKSKVVNHADKRVQDIQRRLKGQGFYTSVVDGLYGKGTASAINAWEQHHGLEANGKISDDEYTLLKAIDDGDRERIAELKMVLRSEGASVHEDHLDIGAQNIVVTESDLNEWGLEYSKLMNQVFLLKACRELKEVYLTTEYTSKGLERVEAYAKSARNMLEKRLQCKGYSEGHIDAVYERGKSIALEGEDAEQLDTVMQMVLMEDHDAADMLARECSNLVDNDVGGFLKYEHALQFNEKVCAYEIPESAGLGFSIR
jgi:peptidoglycan hydrolase-like protein with peptidoglycan-binding domain